VKAGVSGIIYLGVLGETGEGLSEHLSSRREVEIALGRGGVPVTVLRAAMIIGSGSASFEILRYLVERLPIMITPRWVSTESQPIAVRDVLYYLIAALETPATTGKTLDIGGPDVWSYARVMREMASALRLRRRVAIPVPVLTPRLSSLWIPTTPACPSLARWTSTKLANISSHSRAGVSFARASGTSLKRCPVSASTATDPAATLVFTSALIVPDDDLPVRPSGRK